MKDIEKGFLLQTMMTFSVDIVCPVSYTLIQNNIHCFLFLTMM